MCPKRYMYIFVLLCMFSNDRVHDNSTFTFTSALRYAGIRFTHVSAALTWTRAFCTMRLQRVRSAKSRPRTSARAAGRRLTAAKSVKLPTGKPTRPPAPIYSLPRFSSGLPILFIRLTSTSAKPLGTQSTPKSRFETMRSWCTTSSNHILHRCSSHSRTI
ncbi:hypothetical protein JI435_302790 [Parastagonospora nodorum SN15]|uniref:Uncharacterized protein n=1 Tax=Phaeosphaeria nodorum (strain SN15 / ATCC MYA-4574 / FGSC 10173) TaxID=321614 RepID=A0A7U2EXF1_PHANO|nr:hypothetical protein JI435_302790 [Parastagonospora nodorum SN15]